MSRQSSLPAERCPPGPTTPRLHQLWRFKTDFINFVASCEARYGDVFTLRVPPYEALVIATSPIDIRAILCDRERFAGGEGADFVTPIADEPAPGRPGRIEAIAAEQLDRLPVGKAIALRPAMQRITSRRRAAATTLAWAGERLSRHPEAQQRLAAELKEGEDSYLEAVIQETMRNRPPAIEGFRIAVEDTELGGHPVPAGAHLAAMSCLAHRRSDIWEDPLAFRPERFLGAGSASNISTFGDGIRGRAGTPLVDGEIRIVLASMLRRFRLEPSAAAEEKTKLVGTALAPAKGGRVVLRRHTARSTSATEPTATPVSASPDSLPRLR
jgi:cytochrome P450